MDTDPSDEAQPDGGVQPASEDAVASKVGPDAVAGTVTLPGGRELPVALSDDIVDAAQDEGIDVGRLAQSAIPDDVPDDIDFAVTAQNRAAAQDQSATIPVQDQRDMTLASDRLTDFDWIEDPQIRKLQQNSIQYSQRVGRYLLAKDDLIPSVKERIKALIVGSDGLSVEPANPDNDADQKLADHLQDLHENDVRPTDVIDAILRENLMHARAVLRATDLEELDLSTLDYLKDGVTGEEIYMQDPTSVYTFDVDEGSQDEPGSIDVQTKKVDAQPLVIGDQVFDISLYDTPPLEAVADTAVNKMVMQRLKARKAELTSFGAVYAKVEPPTYLPEDQYFDRVQDDDWDNEGDQPPTKIERALRKNMESAFEHLKDWQSGTTMAIPDYWTLEQIDIPDSGTPLDDQIRGYNRSIARRMLVPLDLIELREGAELSRETLFRTLMTTIQGWRAEIIRVFDQFARVQKEIHDLSGDVEYSFPPIQDQDEKLVVQALQYAGVAGLTEKEVRQMLNQVEGIDLDISDDPAPQDVPPGGPDQQGDRTQQMQDFLDQQNQRSRDGQDGRDGSTPDQNPPTASASGGDSPPADFPATCRSCGDRRRIAGRFKCPTCADDVDADTFEGDLAEAGDSGNVNPGPAQDGDAGLPAQGQDGDAGPTGRAAKILRTVPFLPDPQGDQPVSISTDALKSWLAWVRAGRPPVKADWNPSLHPRGPDGQFVERPWDLPDGVVDRIDDMDTATVMTRLHQEGELADQDVEALLGDGGVQVDGLPDDAETVDDLKDAAGAGAMEGQGWTTPDAPDLRVSTADHVEPLQQSTEGKSGSAAMNMDVATWNTDDGERTAFIKHFRDDVDGQRSDGEKPTLAERERAADAFLRNLGMGDHLPEQFHNEDEGYMASAKVDGDNLRGSPPAGADSVDADAFKDFAAATILAGNSDLHGDNWRVQDDGSFAAIDLNKSGGDFSSPGKFRKRGVNMIMNVSNSLGLDFSRQDLQERAQDLADQIDPDQALDGVQNSRLSDADRHQFRENIRRNIEAFQQGDVSL